MESDNIILEGICGSRAYGLDTADSDEDIKGIFVNPTAQVLSLPHFQGRDTYDHTDPDWSYHEVGKYISLALKCNPTFLELLFLDGYRILTKQGHMLVDNRNAFLSSKAVRFAYSGYCLSQAHKLNARGGTYGNGRNKRYEKHTRHLFRLLQQGEEFLTTGAITVRVENRDELFAAGKLPVGKIIDFFTNKFEEFKTIKSCLPDQPDYATVNRVLLKIRKGTW